MFKFTFLLSLASLSLILQLDCSSARCLSCPSGWMTYKGSSSCYRMGTRPTTQWNEARKACFSMGGDLVKIGSPQENRYVVLLARSYWHRNSLMWMGLVGDSNQTFTWVDGTSLSSQKYTNWNSGEPNNYNGQAEDCGMVYLSNMKWNDAICDYPTAMAYMCEKEKTQ